MVAQATSSYGGAWQRKIKLIRLSEKPLVWSIERKWKYEGNEGRNTCASMLIYNNIAFLDNGVEDDTEEVVVFLTSSSL